MNATTAREALTNQTPVNFPARTIYGTHHPAGVGTIVKVSRTTALVSVPHGGCVQYRLAVLTVAGVAA